MGTEKSPRAATVSREAEKQDEGVPGTIEYAESASSTAGDKESEPRRAKAVAGKAVACGGQHVSPAGSE